MAPLALEALPPLVAATKGTQMLKTVWNAFCEFILGPPEPRIPWTPDRLVQRQDGWPGGHPWLMYLAARADCIEWMANEERCNDAEIAKMLSMDMLQVTLIRLRLK